MKSRKGGKGKTTPAVGTKKTQTRRTAAPSTNPASQQIRRSPRGCRPVLPGQRIPRQPISVSTKKTAPTRSS